MENEKLTELRNECDKVREFMEALERSGMIGRFQSGQDFYSQVVSKYFDLRTELNNLEFSLESLTQDVTEKV